MEVWVIGKFEDCELRFKMYDTGFPPKDGGYT
jgi:hypothetical protein